MRDIIETGKTIEEAIEKACASLGLSREEVSIEVLETPRKKLFGSVPAKVRATAEGEEEPFSFEGLMEKASAPEAPRAKTAAPEAPKEKAPAPQRDAAEPSPAQKEAPAQAAQSEKAAAAAAFVQEVAFAMGLEETTVTAVKRGEATVIRVDGKDVAPLIGRRGETMEALSYLTGLVANRTGGDYEKVSLDVGGYRSKREEDLAQLARRVGVRVAKTGRSHTFEPMNPYERRIIHSVIGEIEGVKSESHGEGASRHIVVSCTDPSIAFDGPEKSDRAPRPPRQRGERRPNGQKGGGRKEHGPRPELKDRPAVQIGEKRTDAARPGKGPDEELLEKLSGEAALYGKIEL